ncbi:hypothetical protein BDN71DRAFT_1435006 [Pleurotus eryngii]|uniref:Uncharacterized protein n=1 Tax=Pleurotus eryngii TaxID=5323 RepID=A0A9P5ZKX0_PLEER|nr:hypothetical protein BDN71DRAFT_1435006 [Pleurotus eryngii]
MALSIPEQVIQQGPSTFSKKDMEWIGLLSVDGVDNEVVVGDLSSGWEVHGGTVMTDVDKGKLVLEYWLQLSDMKSVLPFEWGKPDLLWALPVDLMPYIEDTVGQGSRTNSNSRNESNPDGEAPKKAKQATKVPSSAPLTPSGSSSRASKMTGKTPAEKSCTDPFAHHSLKVINGGGFAFKRVCSKSMRAIDTLLPFPLEVVQDVNDIFYHVILSTGKAQLWLWSGSVWSPVKAGETREINDRKYALTIFSGCNHPGWVTRETFH